MSIKQIWFPQIESSNPQDKEDIVVGALRKFYELFGISTGGVFATKNPLTATHNMDQDSTPELFNLCVLLEFLEHRDTDDSIWAFGNFSTEEIKSYSIQELGFNLFDLPEVKKIKIFNYIPLTPSRDDNCLEQLLSFKIEKIDDSDFCINTAELLKCGKCHKACLGIQDPFGHGYIYGHSQRDWLQTGSCRDIFDRLIMLKGNDEKKWSDLPSGNDCLLLKGINKSLDTLKSAPNKTIPCPDLVRGIAFLDCRKYRMVQSKYFAKLHTSTMEKKKEFEKIIILDDNEKFREQLKKDLRGLAFIKNETDIIEAHPQKSWENCCLCDADDKDILYTLVKEKKIEPGNILACFDLDLGRENIPKTAMGEFMKSVFGGQWILYKTASQYPGISRLVITGYRSQDLSSHIAGGAAFLMKPYTQKLLGEQIEEARRSVRRRVTWLCPRNVRKNYSNLFDQSVLTFTDIEDSLKNWLDGKQIDLDIKENVIGIVNTDLVIIDILQIEPKLDKSIEKEELIKELREIIHQIRAQNPNVQFILVLPFDLERETSVSDYYTQLPLNFHDGSDNVIRKPFWFVLDGKTNPEECLGDMIIEQFQHKGDFDVKYQVLVPVAPLVGRLADRIKNILEKPKEIAIDELYAPLLPYLVNAFGLSGRISDIADLGNKVRKKLMDGINYERNKDAARWKNVDPFDISEILDGFIEAMEDVQIKSHINLESWLRHIVDMKPGAVINGEGRKDIHSLTEPLARVFGGSTRYEFSVRGSWYKEANRIDDILIVVEFCAKSSIIGRKFIRETAVKYLSKVAGEDVVLVQEIPIKGFMW